jgi:hypothetical protein
VGRSETIIAVIAGAVVVLCLAFAAGWYAHVFYVRAKLAALLPSPIAPQAESPLATEDSAEDISDPNTEYSPSEKDCPNVRKLGQTSSKKSGPSRTKYFDTKTGQLLAHWEYPDAPKGIVQELKVNPESADEGPSMAGAPSPDAFNLPKNQGVSKIESKPGRYRFSFDPEENQLEYVVTIFECDPSGGEADNQA